MQVLFRSDSGKGGWELLYLSPFAIGLLQCLMTSLRVAGSARQRSQESRGGRRWQSSGGGRGENLGATLSQLSPADKGKAVSPSSSSAGEQHPGDVYWQLVHVQGCKQQRRSVHVKAFVLSLKCRPATVCFLK